jgi:hypothetical protein
MDFATMQQTNQTSGFSRRMHRQQVAARAPPPPTEVMAGLGRIGVSEKESSGASLPVMTI